MQLAINSEFGRLKSAIFHPGDNVKDVEGEEVQLTDNDAAYIKRYLPYHPESSKTPYSPDKLKQQLAAFRQLLTDCGVELHQPTSVQGASMQLFTRDPSFVVGDTLFIARTMGIDYRALELAGLDPIKEQCNHVILNEEIEGGDILVHGSTVYVGVSRHTTYAAVHELENHVSSQGFHCVPLAAGPEVLHADCRIMPFSEEGVVLRPDGLSTEALARIKTDFKDIITVGTPDLALATNFLMIAPDHSVMDPRNEFLGSQFEERGIQVSYLEFDQMTNFWG